MKYRLFVTLIVSLLAVSVLVAQEGEGGDGEMPPMPPPPDLGSGQVVVQGLNSPQGVWVDSEGTLWVADSGVGGEDTIEMINPTNFEVIEAPYGESARIMRMGEDGMDVVAVLPSAVSGQDLLGVARIAERDGELFATFGIWHQNLGAEVTVPYFGDIIRVGDEIETVFDVWEFELENNPDETTNVETHPYDMAFGPDGMLYMTDAAGNYLIKVDVETGEGELVAAFDPLPGVFPSPWRGGELLGDPVPTGVAFDDEGTIFVSYLSPAPFVPGSAKVVTVSEEGEVSDFATGLTMLTDLTYGPDGNLYATSFGMFTQEGPVPNSGSVVRIMPDGTSEVVLEGLPFVTGMAFNDAGDGYVIINGAGIPEAGMVVLYEGLTDMEGMAMEMPQS